MSAFGGKADMPECPLFPRKQTSIGASAMSALCQKRTLLFDHLVGNRKELRRHVQAERFGGVEINHQFDLCRL
jgi:hypothetical protein